MVAGCCGKRAAAAGDKVSLLLRDFSFSARSALKNRSSGERCICREGGTGDTASDSGDDEFDSGVFSPAMRPCSEGWTATFGTDLEKNLGTGSAEAAGEA